MPTDSSIPNAADLDQALAEARSRYARRRPNSLRAFETAQRHMPGGNTRTVLYHGPFPLRIESGERARIRDVDGIEYLNLLGEFTAGIFGHSHPTIHRAIKEALDLGINLSGHTRAEIDLAELIRGRFPSLELLRFTNSGTEANLMAVTAARIATKRATVMVFSGGYHGSVFYFGGGGSPVNAPFPYIVARYNDLEGARAILRERGSDIACVLVEPMIGSGGCIPATPEFLLTLREETESCGAALIFDEVMTSRLSYGGAQQLFGVTPDMTTLGKYLGGGMSFGAFGGAARFMSMFDPRAEGALPHAGTFNNNALTMAAGRAALSEVLTQQVLSDLNQRGDGLRRRLNSIFSETGANFSATGMGSLINIHPTNEELVHQEQVAGLDDRMRELLFLDLLESGFYIARRGFIALNIEIMDDEISQFGDCIAAFVDKYSYLIANE